MKFKIWLENTITRDTAKTFVLDAVGAGDSPGDDQSNLVGSLIGRYNDLGNKLSSFSELRPYDSEISGYIYANGKRTLQDLINFIADLDNKEADEPASNVPSVDQGGLPDAPSPDDEHSPI